MIQLRSVTLVLTSCIFIRRYAKVHSECNAIPYYSWRHCTPMTIIQIFIIHLRTCQISINSITQNGGLIKLPYKMHNKKLGVLIIMEIDFEYKMFGCHQVIWYLNYFFQKWIQSIWQVRRSPVLVFIFPFPWEIFQNISL